PVPPTGPSAGGAAWPPTSGSHLDDGALFASAAAATIDPAVSTPRLATPLPPIASTPNLHDTLDDNNPPPPSVPEPLDLKMPPRSGPLGSPRVDPTAVTAPPDAPAPSLPGNPCPSCGNEVPPGFLF